LNSYSELKKKVDAKYNEFAELKNQLKILENSLINVMTRRLGVEDVHILKEFK